MKPVFLLPALALMSCGQPTAGERSAGAPKVAVADAWARPAAAGKPVSAAYMTLANAGDGADRLLGIDASTGAAEIHSTSMEGGIMRMRKLDSLDLPAGATVRLAPGGTHIMLLGLRDSLDAGDRVELTLRFEKSAPQRVAAEVRAEAGAGR